MRVIAFVLAIASGLLAQSPREEALSRVAAVSESISRFEDEGIALRWFTNLGQIVCRYDLPAAAAVFDKAGSAIRGVNTDPEEHERVRGVLLWQASRCDADLGERLRVETEPVDRDLARSFHAILPQAEALVRENPARAVGIASSLLPAIPSLNDEQVSDWNRFLLSLHDADGGQADRLYLDSLSHLPAQLQWRTIQVLGNYLFRSAGESDTSSALAGEVEVFDWSLRRDTASADAVTAYLRTVASSFASTPDRTGLPSVLAQQLIEHAAAVAPELATVFRDVSKEGKADTMEFFAQSSSKSPIESPNPWLRDRERISRFWHDVDNRHFDKARETVAAMEELSLHGQLLRFAELEEALAAIRDGDLSQAADKAARMQPDVHQALLYLALGNGYLKSDRERAALMLDFGRSATAVEEPTTRSRVLLANAALQAEIDPEKSLAILAEAVGAFNEVRPRRSPRSNIRFIGNMLMETVVGEKDRYYGMVPLHFAAVELFHFSGALRRFVDLDLDRVDAILANLQGDELSAEARIYACELRLKLAFDSAESDSHN